MTNVSSVPSRKAAVRALIDAGAVRPAEIAARLGEPLTMALRVCISEVRREHTTVTIHAAQRAALAPHATARGVSVPKLLRMMLDAIIADDLVDAILDDSAAAGGQPKRKKDGSA